MKAPLIAVAFGIVVIAVLLSAQSQISGGGPVVNGLQMFLKADKDRIAPGETLTLTVTMRNLTDQDVKLNIAWWGEKYFETGFGLGRIPIGQDSRLMHMARMLADDWGSSALISVLLPEAETIPRRSSKSWPIPLRLTTAPRGRFFMIGAGANKRYLQAPPGRCRLSWMYVFSDSENAYARMGHERKPKPTAEFVPFWEGKIYANEVAIDILWPVEPAAKAE